MEKIKINTNLFRKLNTLCENMQIPANAKADRKMAEHLRQLYHTSSYMADDLNVFADRVDDILSALYVKDFTNGISLLSDAVEQTEELQESLEAMCNELAGSLAALRQLIEPAGWKAVRTDEEVKKIIEDGFSVTNSMSLGYENGQYALLFEESETDSTMVLPPYVVAIGGEDDYKYVRAYIESFMDMDEE